MNYLDEIKKQIKEATTPCTHSNEVAGWFTRVDQQGMAMYQFDREGDLHCKRYKTIGTFARAIMNKLNGF